MTDSIPIAYSVSNVPSTGFPSVDLDQIVTTTGATGRSGFVFSDDDGATAWKPNRAMKSFLRSVDGGGVRRFRLHDLRHFIATELLQAGVALAVVSQRLDHQRAATTLDYYAHAVHLVMHKRLTSCARLSTTREAQHDAGSACYGTPKVRVT